MTYPRKRALRDLQRLGQEWDYPERLQEWPEELDVHKSMHCDFERRYPLQQFPEQPDEFTISMRMWAVMICGGIACWAVIIGLLGRIAGFW